jgi:uncharacterized membrane protein
MITLQAVFILVGLLFAGFAVTSALDATNPRRFGSAAFQGLVAVSFLFGDRLGDVANGVLVLGLAALAGLGAQGRGKPATTPQQRQASADRFGDRLFIPALLLPALLVFALFVLRPLHIGPKPLMDPKQGALICLAMAVIAALIAALALLRQPLSSPVQEGRRLMDLTGWAPLLPQLLAALGAIFALTGVGQTLGDLISHWLPADSRLGAVIVYGAGMALFTAIMGNAFAAFPVMTAAVGIPILIHHFHGDPAAVCALGMLSGFCGTLVTPLAANFNVVPVALLELNDRSAVIKAQAPAAGLLLLVNLGLLYVFAFHA